MQFGRGALSRSAEYLRAQSARWRTDASTQTSLLRAFYSADRGSDGDDGESGPAGRALHDQTASPSVDGGGTKAPQAGVSAESETPGPAASGSTDAKAAAASHGRAARADSRSKKRPQEPEADAADATPLERLRRLERSAGLQDILDMESITEAVEKGELGDEELNEFYDTVTGAMDGRRLNRSDDLASELESSVIDQYAQFGLTAKQLREYLEVALDIEDSLQQGMIPKIAPDRYKHFKLVHELVNYGPRKSPMEQKHLEAMVWEEVLRLPWPTTMLRKIFKEHGAKLRKMKKSEATMYDQGWMTEALFPFENKEEFDLHFEGGHTHPRVPSTYWADEVDEKGNVAPDYRSPAVGASDNSSWGQAIRTAAAMRKHADVAARAEAQHWSDKVAEEEEEERRSRGEPDAGGSEAAGAGAAEDADAGEAGGDSGAQSDARSAREGVETGGGDFEGDGAHVRAGAAATLGGEGVATGNEHAQAASPADSDGDDGNDGIGGENEEVEVETSYTRRTDDLRSEFMQSLMEAQADENIVPQDSLENLEEAYNEACGDPDVRANVADVTAEAMAIAAYEEQEMSILRRYGYDKDSRAEFLESVGMDEDEWREWVGHEVEKQTEVLSTLHVDSRSPDQQMEEILPEKSKVWKVEEPFYNLREIAVKHPRGPLSDAHAFPQCIQNPHEQKHPAAEHALLESMVLHMREEKIVPEIFRFTQTVWYHLGHKPFHPGNRRVVLNVSIHDLIARYGLTNAATQHLIMLAGSRYNRHTGEIRMSCDRNRSREENRRQLLHWMIRLVESSLLNHPSEEWEELKGRQTSFMHEVLPSTPQAPPL